MFENVKTLSELKKEYRALALQYHPDCGGSDEMMQQLNLKYEALFPIFKRKENNTSNETASSTRSEFYTEYGWKGSNYNINLTLKEIANIVRAYVKSVYPEFKFSITTHYASMCQSLSVSIMQGDCPAYKKPEEWNEKEQQEATQTIFHWEEYNYTQDEIEKMKQTLFMTDRVKSVKEDVDRFVNSYNYDDSDSMTDYFDTNFYYIGGASIGTYDKPYTVKEFKGKKDSGITYEPVKETRKKVKKYKKAEICEKSDNWKVGDCFIICSNFNYGYRKGYVYRIEKAEEGYFFAYKMNRALTKICTGFSTSENHWYLYPEKFEKWLQAGHLKPCKIVDAEKVEEYEVTTFKAKRETKPATRKAEPKKQEQPKQEKPQYKTAAERMEEVKRKNAELKAHREAKKAQQQESKKSVCENLPQDKKQEVCESVKETLQTLIDIDIKSYEEVQPDTLQAIEKQGYCIKDGKLCENNAANTAPEQEKQPETAVSQSFNQEPLQEKENETERKKQALQTAQKIEEIVIEILTSTSYKYTQQQRQWHTPQFKELLKEKLEPLKDSLNNLVIERITFEELKKILQTCMNGFEKDMEENNNV